MASLLLWTRERRCASPAAATAAAWGGAGLLQAHRAGPPERRPREEVRAIDLQQQPSCWLCRRRISRAAPSCRATCGSSGRGGPLDEPPRRSESSPQARCCGASREAERHGEGSWHASGATRGLLQLLGWPKPLRFPRLAGLAHNLVNLIYSINHHDGFCHLLTTMAKRWQKRSWRFME